MAIVMSVWCNYAIVSML
uniref:Uncharacterized protein n=1 Tax=Arundo donax TaxID=35708 RepID=A0A0A9A0G4_ARUDO